MERSRRLAAQLVLDHSPLGEFDVRLMPEDDPVKVKIALRELGCEVVGEKGPYTFTVVCPKASSINGLSSGSGSLFE